MFEYLLHQRNVCIKNIWDIIICMYEKNILYITQIYIFDTNLKFNKTKLL